jgi:SAM-dependent methyltransferase
MIEKTLPYFLTKYLFGDRKRYGKTPNVSDQDWVIWQKKSISDFYKKTQQTGIGKLVCGLEYYVISRVNLGEKRILEVGPGVIRHIDCIRKKPNKYTICDVRRDVLEMAKEQLIKAGIPCEKVLTYRESGPSLPFPDKSFDAIISFNSLEHLHPLDEYLLEMKRILIGGGHLVGGIPCEGGIAWGLGRFLTTRRYVNKKYGINYDKIICWEHPNFADLIIEQLDMHFSRKYLKLLPFPWLPIDFNLVGTFVYRKRSEESNR